MLTRALAGHPDMLVVFSDRALFGAFARFEAALAEAEAACGVIPRLAATKIVGTLGRFEPDAARLIVEARQAGPLAIPYVAALREAVPPEASAFVHFGATSQDLMDTALVLQLGEAQRLLASELGAFVDALCSLSERHDGTVLIGRTLLQPAQPVTLGLKLAHWAVMLADTRISLEEAARSAFMLQFGGAVGTLALLGENASAVAAGLAARLDLPLPVAPWHARRDRLARYGAAVAVLAGVLGKIGREVALSMQAEVAEFGEANPGGSSAMPHKANPVAAVRAVAAASRAAGMIGALIAGLPNNEHERGLGGWQSEGPIFEDLLLTTHGALTALRPALSELQVHPGRMGANLAALCGLFASEAAMGLLAPTLGRAQAIAVVDHAAKVALAEEIPFTSALTRDARPSGETAAALAHFADPAALLGEASVFAAALRAEARRSYKAE